MLDFPSHYATRVAQFEKECARFMRSGRGQEGVVFLGDSLAEAYRGPIPWVNRGVASDHLKWPQFSVFERLGSDRLHPDPLGIVTLIGINDLADEPTGVARIANGYRHLLANLKQRYPNARLAVFSVLPTCGVDRHLNPRITELNRELVDVAAAQGAVYWNLHDRLLNPRTGDGRSEFYRDGTHLNRRGYAEMTAFVEAHAEELELRTPDGQRATDALRARVVPAELTRAWELVRSQVPLLGGAPADPTQAIDRQKLGAHIAQAYGRECWAHKAETGSDEEFIAAHIIPELDFLCRYAATGSPLFSALYLGSRAGFFAQNKALWKEQPEGLRAALDRDRALWLEVLGASPETAPLCPRFEALFTELRASFPASHPKGVKLLFVGDCLLEDVELLLGGQLLRQGLLAKVHFVLSKNPMQQIQDIKALRSEKFDGVVYSPLSWDFDPEFRNFLEPALRSRKALEANVEAIWKRVSSTIKLLADSFESPIYVHNTAATVRASSEVRRVVKSLLTYRDRDWARKEFGRRIGELLQELNRTTFQHLVLVDELAAVRDLRDDLTLGRVLYYSDAIHPAMLSSEVTLRLSSYIVAAARFVSKKVVVCDLDNTLWDGVIGEGLGVRHQKERQQILKALKQKGVVLAINSKNDPANVRWEDSVLTAEDFVASEISWGPKAAAMKRIHETLNLKLKDSVFIDDRADERAMISQEFPELITMDPCAEQTWAVFDAWAKLLGNDEGDRTQLYRERAEREKVIGEQVDPSLATDLFMKLDLKIDIRPAAVEDLKRVHELINRTNQWNLQGTRCGFGEVKLWHDSPDYVVYTARVSDKFGDMGLISVCVAHVQAEAIDVPVFVLSCRVFGYGVETLLLERIKKDAIARFGAPRVRGTYIENAHNKPCSSMYEAHGFVREGDHWVCPGGKVTAPDPVWFKAA